MSSALSRQFSMQYLAVSMLSTTIQRHYYSAITDVWHNAHVTNNLVHDTSHRIRCVAVRCGAASGANVSLELVALLSTSLIAQFNNVGLLL